MNSLVKEKLHTYPKPVREKLHFLREMIFEVAKNTEGVGEIEETLKWNEPAYLTKNKSGTTIRIDWKANNPNYIGFYINCKTTLIDTYRSLFPELNYEGNRAILLPVDQPLPKDAIRP